MTIILEYYAALAIEVPNPRPSNLHFTAFIENKTKSFIYKHIVSISIQVFNQFKHSSGMNV